MRSRRGPSEAEDIKSNQQQKNIMKKITLFFLLLSLLIFSGCGISELLYDVRTVDTGETVQEDFTDAEGNLVVAGTPIFEEVHVLKPWVKSSLQSTGVIPIPYADLLGVIATGVLSIGGVWLNKKKRRSEKVSESLVKGIESARAMLRTEAGPAIDKELTRLLHDQQANLQVIDDVSDLLKRFTLPTPPPRRGVTEPVN